jgi:hypothetical protein
MNALEKTRPTSARIGIARLAQQVIAADPGVGPTRGGARWLTRDADRVISGVVVAVDGAGRVEVDLHLVAYLPPRPLGEQATSLRAALFTAAQRAGGVADLGEIDVTIHDLRERPADAGVASQGEVTS